MKTGQTISLKARALRYLSAREHSRMELAKKLARYAGDDDDIEKLLDELTAAKFLSEARFAESLVHRRIGRFGNGRILRELEQHGLDAADLTDIRTSLQEDEPARALAVWRKKFSHPPTDAQERARQMRFLLQRGFSHETIRATLRAVAAE